MVVSSGAYVLSIVLIIMGFFFFYVSKKLSVEDKKKNNFFNKKGFFLVLALVYILFGKFGLLAGLGLDIASQNQPICEQLLNYTDERFIYGDNYSDYHWDYNSETPTCNPNDDDEEYLDCVNLFHIKTDYNYINSCEDNNYSTLERFYSGYSYLLLLEIILLFFGGFFITIKKGFSIW